ncbi:MAG: hypothetical protein APF76_08320 [Desulfitibacter sp. BRH_c19]|nr:MAG: hypothetical protein APF76_08320 [Desulfitibacter sp. BRH_c19]
MEEFNSFGRILLILGVVIFLLGGLIMIAGKVPYIGRLPGDIFIKRENFTFYFPLATGILLSIILTIVINLFFRR